MSSRLAAGAAALVLGAGLSVAALPASAAPAATHTVTYSPGVVGVLPSLSTPSNGAVRVGDTIVFKNTAQQSITVSSSGGQTLVHSPLVVGKGTTSAALAVGSAGTYDYQAVQKVLGLLSSPTPATGTFTTTDASVVAPPPAGSTPAPGGGILQAPAQNNPGAGPQPPAKGTGSGGAGAAGPGSAATGSGSAGAAGSSGSGNNSGFFSKAQFGSGSGDFPSLPGGVFAPLEPQARAADGGPAPQIAGLPASGAAGSPVPSPFRYGSPGDTITNAAQVVGNASSGSSVTGPAGAAAALLALVAVGLSRAWVDQRPLRRH